jgi:bifunctional UDP-N-acetylglucosamine pyrophosphorylase / glucosamine-1-phosphate N-acetyltransferase
MRAAVVLAAGRGTRLRSDTPKVLHRAAGRTLLRWVLEAIRPLDLDRVVVVVGHGGDLVAAEAAAADLPGLSTVVQAEQRGTGHAVRCALGDDALDGVDEVLVLAGDVPALPTASVEALLEQRAGHAAAVLTTRLPDPTGYGRVVRDVATGVVAAIVEHADADAATRAVDEVNTGTYVFDAAALREALGRLAADNAQGEEYLTDVVADLVAGGRGVRAVEVGPEEVLGVNDRSQLAEVEAVLRRRVLDRLMREGVRVVDPGATYVDADVVVEPDATLLPGTMLHGATTVGAGAVIGPWSRLTDTVVHRGATVAATVADRAEVGEDAAVGPWTHLRAGTALGPRTKAGSFVEMKQAVVGEGSKVPHLSYVGDAEVGRGANLGAGVVTVNYDGFTKSTTTIGDGAFVGSDVMLVAPLTVGAGAVVGAGSTITTDVPPDALAIERAERRTIDGWAARRRARHEER